MGKITAAKRQLMRSKRNIHDILEGYHKCGGFFVVPGRRLTRQRSARQRAPLEFCIYTLFKNDAVYCKQYKKQPLWKQLVQCECEQKKRALFDHVLSLKADMKAIRKKMKKRRRVVLGCLCLNRSGVNSHIVFSQLKAFL